MGKHIAPFDNKNKPIIDVNDETTPLCFFNPVNLKKGENTLLMAVSENFGGWLITGKFKNNDTIEIITP